MFNSLLWHKIDIYSQALDVPDPNSVGGFSRTATIKYSNVPCNVQWLGGKKEVPLFGKANIPAQLVVTCQADYLLSTTDLVYIPWEQKYYEILFINDCIHSMWAISKARHYEIYLKLTYAPQIVTPESSSSESSDSSSSSESSSSSSTEFMSSSSSSSSSE